MAELLANTDTAITTLAAAISDTSGTTIQTTAAAPVALQTAGGQFRIRIDNELMLVTGGATGTTWTVTRGAEGSTANTHTNFTSIYHPLTAGALQATVGKSLLTGTGVPSNSLGNLGDSYIDTAASMLYSPKANAGLPLAFPSVGLLDNFTRANENPLSNASQWGSPNFSSDPGTVALVGNAVVGSGSAYWNQSTWTDTDVWATVGTITDHVQLYLRTAATNGSWNYRVKFLQGNVSIYRASDASLIATGNPGALNTGDKIGARMVGSTLTAWHQPFGGAWTQVVSITDTTYANAGYVGIGLTSGDSITAFGAGATVFASQPAWPAGVSLIGPTGSFSGQIGVPNGVAGLDQTGRVFLTELGLINSSRGILFATREAVSALPANGSVQSHPYDTQDPLTVGSDGIMLFSTLINTDQSGTLVVQSSPDGVAWTTEASVATSAVGSKQVARFSGIPSQRYVQAVETNGATPQTSNLFLTTVSLVEAA